MRRWAATPFYGALLSPLYLLARELGAWLIGGIAGGAALALLARRVVRRGTAA